MERVTRAIHLELAAYQHDMGYPKRRRSCSKIEVEPPLFELFQLFGSGVSKDVRVPAVRKRKLVGLAQRDVRERKEKRDAQTEPTPRPT